MKETEITYPKEKKALYRLLKVRLQGLMDGVPYITANLANASALLKEAVTKINWAGFYIIEDGCLVLGPFQGRPACVRISMGSGVCGTAAARDEILMVENVHEFPGHIACDSASNSEIVLPLHKDGRVLGVLDIESPEFARCDEQVKEVVSDLQRLLEAMLKNH